MSLLPQVTTSFPVLFVVGHQESLVDVAARNTGMPFAQSAAAGLIIRGQITIFHHFSQSVLCLI